MPRLIKPIANFVAERNVGRNFHQKHLKDQQKVQQNPMNPANRQFCAATHAGFGSWQTIPGSNIATDPSARGGT